MIDEKYYLYAVEQMDRAVRRKSTTAGKTNQSAFAFIPADLTQNDTKYFMEVQKEKLVGTTDSR